MFSAMIRSTLGSRAARARTLRRLWLGMSLASVAAAPAIAAPGDVFPVGAQAEKLWGEGRLTEAVDVAPDGAVYFADLALGAGPSPPRTFRFDPATGRATLFLAANGNTNGQKIGPDGRLWSAQTSAGGSRDLRVVDLRTRRVEVVASRYGGRRFNAPNDLVFDAAGRVWMTDLRAVGSEPIEQPFNAVYRIDRNRTVTLVVADIRSPNGIAISPDGRTLYVSEYPYASKNVLAGERRILPMSIRAYEITADGQAVHGRVFADFGLQEGADGMAVDDRGDLLVAFRADTRRGVRVFAPDGQEIDFLPLPEKPTNLAFARGADRHVLYVTAGRSLYRVTTKVEGAAR